MITDIVKKFLLLSQILPVLDLSLESWGWLNTILRVDKDKYIMMKVVCSGLVEETVKVVNATGHDMILELDQEGNVLVGEVKLMLRDKVTTNGLIHVIGNRRQIKCRKIFLYEKHSRRCNCSPGSAWRHWPPEDETNNLLDLLDLLSKLTIRNHLRL